MDISNKITFKDIEKANSTLKTMKITRWDKKQGKEISKDYAEVNQRIKAFRMLYPEGFIRTNIISHNDGVVVMKTEAGFVDESGNDRILGTGMAFEDKKNGLINGTSYIENCETSSVGRALGMIGLGIDMSIASYEEVNNAIAQQEEMQVVPDKKPAAKKAPAKKAPAADQIICQRCGKPIQPFNGNTPHQIANATMKRFGKVMCMACGSATKQEQEAQAQMVQDEELQLPFPIED